MAARFICPDDCKGCKGVADARDKRIQAGPDGPALSIVSTGFLPSRQGTASDMSNTSAMPALTALAIGTAAEFPNCPTML
jgi:hypothetical protein